MHNVPNKPLWLSEMVAVWGYVQRNYFLTKRYLMWEVVWLVYVTINAMAITFIGAGVEAAEFGSVSIDTEQFLMTYLLIGALLWNYLSMLFDVLSETVSWERWEGTIEYTFMSPSSRVTHLPRDGTLRGGLRHFADGANSGCLLPVLRPRANERELRRGAPDPGRVQRLARRLRHRGRRAAAALPREGPAGQLHSLVRPACWSLASTTRWTCCRDGCRLLPPFRPLPTRCREPEPPSKTAPESRNCG